MFFYFAGKLSSNYSAIPVFGNYFNLFYLAIKAGIFYNNNIFYIIFCKINSEFIIFSLLPVVRKTLLKKS